MTELRAEGPNAEQIEYWNDVSGPRWVSQQHLLDEMIAPLGETALERARVAAGERVLDIGCGCGDSSLELARRVTPSGSVTGIDLSRVMLERARARAVEAKLDNLTFEPADAQTVSFAAGTFDLLFSRFGVMFFADPVAAFANLRGSLRAGGRLAFLCWQAVTENPWMLVPMGAIASVVELPAPTPGAPGPFAFADPERVTGILESAGFAEVSLDSVQRKIVVGGGSVEGAVDFMMRIGPAGAALREADDAARKQAERAIGDALSPLADDQGQLRLDSATWIVTAVSPD